MEEKTTINYNPLPLTTIGLITFIVFAILKWGTHVIDWPDFWIWFPLWLPWAITGAIFLILFLFALIYTWAKDR